VFHFEVLKDGLNNNIGLGECAAKTTKTTFKTNEIKTITK
jgi:hypothetical protein